jgi:hypothetical protein
MHMGRFTRFMDAFSKKLKNFSVTVSFHFAHYYFCRLHLKPLHEPAMAGGVTKPNWTVQDLISA